ncbi:MAG: hypothetical protein JOZ57_02390, partial [Abitibacteriaceae bacterium]|nr:hypothetical protein [Abditibacteriaceae bacterium]
MPFPTPNRRTRRLLFAVAYGHLTLGCQAPILAAPAIPNSPTPAAQPNSAPQIAPTQEPGNVTAEQMPFQKIPEIAPPVILAQNTLPPSGNNPTALENNPTAPATTVGSNTQTNTSNTNGTGIAPPVQNPAAPPINGQPNSPTSNNGNPANAIITPPANHADDPTSGSELPRQEFHVDAPGGVIEDTEQELIFSQGPMTFTYGRDFVVHGDRGVYDERSHKAVLTGNLTVTVRGKEFKGKKIVFNTDTGGWVLSQIDRIFQPDEFPYGTVLDPLYVSGAAVSGAYDRTTGDISSVQGSNFKFTSCDRDHYYILSKRLDFYRDAKGEPDRIVLHRNSLYLFRHKIIPLPAYVIPLNGQRSRRLGLQPTVGQNDIDGFFVRTLYDLAANEHRTDSLLIDALQKRGIGLGFQRELAAGAGLFYLYGLTGNGKTSGREFDTRIQRILRISKS